MPVAAPCRAVPRGRLLWVLLSGVASVAAPFAQAQTTPFEPSDPDGWLTVGAGRFAPSVAFDWTWSDNVFRVAPQGSGAVGVRPQSSALLQVSPTLKFEYPYSQSR